jgi:hypothetical protein
MWLIMYKRRSTVVDRLERSPTEL